jgi:plasmid maintenance system killer protein
VKAGAWRVSAVRRTILVNEQWRVLFRWEGNNAHEVRLTDYH